METQTSPSQFVQWFRSVAPYVRVFRGRTFVIAFGGEVVAHGKFVALTQDLNLLASLGVRLVLVHGARPQIERLLALRKIKTEYVRGIRVTDSDTLHSVKEATGRLRTEIEALLSMGLANSTMANAQIRVSGGNFVTAQPRGVLDGVDMLYSGEVRKIDSEAIIRQLDGGDIVLLSTLGYSPSGETFNLILEDVASAAAASINADKLIFLIDEPGIRDARKRLVKELTVSQAEEILAKERAQSADIKLYLPHALNACREGVERAHFVSGKIDGALMTELFTHDGIGSMVTRDKLEKLRPAKIDDIGGILQLIVPLEREGILVKRSRETMEMEIDRFTVLEHDKMIVGCAALHPFPESGMAELACLAVQPERRNVGAGERLLKHVETQALDLGLKKIFVLTTKAEHWFRERGFVPEKLESLPVRKLGLYNYQRRSKIFVKAL